MALRVGLRRFQGLINLQKPNIVTQNSWFCSSPEKTSEVDSQKPKQTVSKAMAAYLTRAREHDEFMKTQETEFKIGRRHLANMMGEDPEMFTQDDIDRAIEYLFPAGLFDPRARPMMKPPEEVFPKRKAAEFDESGRPFHFLFYTGTPNFYSLLFDVVDHMQNLNRIEDECRVKNMQGESVDLSGSEWLTKDALEKLLVETLPEKQYNEFLRTMARLAEHPFSERIKDFIFKYRKMIINQADVSEIPKPEYDREGRAFITVIGCLKKTARGEVTVRKPGTGKVLINNHDITYFPDLQERQQILFPLELSGLLGKVDVEGTVANSGYTSQAAAMRWGIAWALRSFVDSDTVERLRLAGLLLRDTRRRERKKPGQEGARRKYTWKKR